MNEKSDNAASDAVCIDIPKAMYERVEAYCASRNLKPEEFIFDAVSEKLGSVHRERRKKQRL